MTDVARIGTLLASLAVFLGGCGTAGGVPRDTSEDGGPPGASAADGGRSFGEDAGVFAGELCFGAEEDAWDDCAEARCGAVAACCVGSAEPRCCRSAGERVLVACASGACLPAGGVRLFGGELPTLAAGGGVVARGGSGEGGVALAEPVDLRAHNLTLRASLEVPAERCRDCLDTLGIAVLSRIPEPHAAADVALGVLVSGARDEVQVWLAGEVVARGALPAGTVELALETDVAGRGRVSVGGVSLATLDALRLPPEAYVALLGRSAVPESVEPVRALSARASFARCAVPSALTRASTPVLPASESGWAPSAVRQPSVVRWSVDGAPTVLMAFVHGDEIHLATRLVSGEYRGAEPEPGVPALRRPMGIASARDPWLFVHEEQLHLFFTGVDPQGRTSIWRAAAPRGSLAFELPTRALEPHLVDLPMAEAPTVLAGPDWTMVVRTVLGGRPALVQLHSVDAGASWSLGATLTTARGDDLLAFDRDDVVAPALVVDPQGLRRLYYAGRRGTRLGVGLLVEGSGAWRRMGEVLGPSGVGFDERGVTDPAPLVEDGELRLFYAGTEGNRWRIGQAWTAALPSE